MNVHDGTLSDLLFDEDDEFLDALDTATFTYGFIWGREALARELKLISADQMSHIQKVADEALEDWKTFFL